MNESLSLVLSKLQGVKQQPSGQYLALCPAHEDRQPSLSVGLGDDGRVLLKCFAGCETDAILDALGLTAGDLFPSSAEKPDNGTWSQVATYDYRDASDRLAFQVLREENGTSKRFRCRRPDGNGSWIWSMKNTERLLYRLPELLKADPGTPIFVVEGEKDADELAGAGILATCSPHGAGKWQTYQQHYNGVFRGRRVVVIPDNDQAGRLHARQVVNGIKDLAGEVRVLELPDLPEKGDTSDWLDNGGTPSELLSLAAAAPTMAEWVDADETEAEPDQEAQGWTWRTLADACQPKEPRQYLVSGLLPLPSLTVLFGKPGDLKTMLLLDLATCVAGGQPWLGGLPSEPGVAAFDVQEQPALIIDVDNGLDLLERRLAAISKAHQVSEDAALAYVSFPSPPFLASDPASVDLVIEAALAVQARLICFDNLGTISGGADENSSQMVAVMGGLRQIAEATGAVVVVIHHPTKAEKTRPGDRLRGHSSIEAAVDLALLVERKEGDDAVSVYCTKSRGAPVSPFSALWTYEQDGSGDLALGQFYGLGLPESGGFTKLEQAKSCILHEMQNGMNQSAMVKLVRDTAGVGRSTALTAIRRLVGEGKLREIVGQYRNATEYERVESVV